MMVIDRIRRTNFSLILFTRTNLDWIRLIYSMHVLTYTNTTTFKYVFKKNYAMERIEYQCVCVMQKLLKNVIVCVVQSRCMIDPKVQEELNKRC